MHLLNISDPAHIGAGIFILGCAIASVLFFSKACTSSTYKTKLRFIVSGFVFVMGAAGMEALGSQILSNGYQSHKIAYNLGVFVEQSLEIIGVLLFIRAIPYYIQENLLNDNTLFHRVPAIPEAAQKNEAAKIAVK